MEMRGHADNIIKQDRTIENGSSCVSFAAFFVGADEALFLFWGNAEEQSSSTIPTAAQLLSFIASSHFAPNISNNCRFLIDPLEACLHSCCPAVYFTPYIVSSIPITRLLISSHNIIRFIVWWHPRQTTPAATARQVWGCQCVQYPLQSFLGRQFS